MKMGSIFAAVACGVVCGIARHYYWKKRTRMDEQMYEYVDHLCDDLEKVDGCDALVQSIQKIKRI